MKTIYTVIVLIITGLLLAWLINMDFLLSQPTLAPKSQLNADLNACIAISEKSVSHMQAKVAFQQLEIVGRKARVMRMCMKDHGYTQNPDWTIFGQSSAKTISKDDNVSFNEAFETLRRDYMVQLNTPNNTPPFWIPAH